MSIAIKRVKMPAKSSPERSSELRKALMTIKVDSDEAVLLFPDSTVSLKTLRNRASGAVSALKKDDMHFVTRTAEAVPPNSPEDAEAIKCVGIWRVSPATATPAPAGAAQPTDNTPKTTAEPKTAPQPTNGKASASKGKTLDSLPE